MNTNKQETIEVKSIIQLQNVLTPLKSSINANEMVAHALTAQLRVLEMIQSIELTASAFDLFLESIHMAITKANNDRDCEDIQKKAAAMMQSLFFFIDIKKNLMIAELEYRIDKMEEEELEAQKELIKTACGLLADTAASIIKVYRPKSTVVINLLAQFKDTDEIQKITPSFIDTLMSLWDGGNSWKKKQNRLKSKIRKTIQKTKQEYDSFIFSSFDKIDKYRKIFGKSILLNELVNRYKNKLIEHRYNSIKNYEYPKKPEPKKLKKPRRPPVPSRPTLGLKAIFIIPIFLYRAEMKHWYKSVAELEEEYNDDLAKYENALREYKIEYENKLREYEMECLKIKEKNEKILKDVTDYYTELATTFSINY
jgi:hypothetical protein